MKLTTSEKKLIGARARTLHERLESPLESGSQEDIEVDTILERWRDNVADGDEEKFKIRLEQMGLTQEDCRELLNRTKWPANQAPPLWTNRIAGLVEFLHAHGPADLSSDYDYPFGHIIRPIIEYAWENVELADAQQFHETAFVGFKRWLQDRLTPLFSHALFIEFRAYISRFDEDLAFGNSDHIPDDQTRYYKNFLNDILDDGLKSFFKEYSFLARSLDTIIQQWIDAIHDFSSRLANDREELKSAMGVYGKVRSIDVKGDPHNCGRYVLVVTFQSQGKLVYKPRDVGIEHIYGEFIGWFNRHSSLTLTAASTLNKDEYGWMDWVESSECKTIREVQHYFRRAGALLAIFYALRYTDGHLENIIASGGYPYAIDLETLTQPSTPVSKLPNGGGVREILEKSVLYTGLVPTHNPGGELEHVSGFGSDEGHGSGIQIPNFSDTNTDSMDLEYLGGYNLYGENLPKIDGSVVEPSEYCREICTGFKLGYKLFLNEREELLSADGPLGAFDGEKIRFLYRPTWVYRRIHGSMVTPDYLRTGVRFGCRIESLATPFISGSVDGEVLELYKCERTAVRRFDIPRFWTNTDAVTIHFREDDVIDLFDSTSMSMLSERIAGLCKSDLREQLNYIEWGFTNERKDHPGVEGPERIEVDESTKEIDNVELRSRQIFERIMGDSKRTEDRSPTWFLREIGHEGGVYVHSVEEPLYAGRVGISLYFAALFKVTGNSKFYDVTIDTIKPVIEQVENGANFSDMPIGGGSGVASIVYGLTKIGQLLGDNRFIDYSIDTANRISVNRIDGDSIFDVMAGSAGVILCLLSHYHATGNQEALRRAEIAGNHLLEKSVDRNGTPVWTTITENQPLTGFAHGSAGISYSLFKLGKKIERSDMMEVAMNALRFEERNYNDDECNWYDLRGRTEGQFMDAWCHGRAGVGMARIGMLELEERERFKKDITRAIHGIDETILFEKDHICCGNFARVEFLVRAARTLEDKTAMRKATQIASAACERAEDNEKFATEWQTSHWYNSAFFRGESGIGYSLLRLMHPNLPCVLLFE